VNEIEDLLRETLLDPRRRLDPDPEHYSKVERRARTLRRRRAAWWAGAVTALVAIVSVAAVTAATRPAAPAPRPADRPTTHAPLPVGGAEPIAGVVGETVDLTAAAGSGYLLGSNPDQVTRIDLASRRITGTVPAPAGPEGLAVDPVAGRLWAWGCSPAACGARAYDLASLTPIRDVPVPEIQIFSAVPLAGELWVAAGGLYRIGAASTTPEKITVVGSHAYGLAADPGRGRILVTGLDSEGVMAIDPSLNLTRGGSPLGLGKSSLAVVAGQIWVGGYGSGETPRVVRLDPKTLRPVGGSPVNQQVGPGAILWPGAGVVWVRAGGDEGLSCLRPGDGAILRQWREVQGPVASVSGTALAAHNGEAVWLTLGGSCLG
jgi:hypothetical protein